MPLVSPKYDANHPHQWNEPWFDLLVGAHRLAKQAQRDLAQLLSEIETNETQFLVLWCIARHKDSSVPQSDLVAALGFSKAQISQQLEKLRGEGLILGVRPADDRRRQHWQCTPQGHSLIHQVTGRLDDRVCRSQAFLSTFNDLSGDYEKLPSHTNLRIHGEEQSS